MFFSRVIKTLSLMGKIKTKTSSVRGTLSAICMSATLVTTTQPAKAQDFPDNSYTCDIPYVDQIEGKRVLVMIVSKAGYSERIELSQQPTPDYIEKTRKLGCPPPDFYRKSILFRK